MYKHLGLPMPKNEYWKCPECGDYFQRHELVNIRHSKYYSCPECIFVTVEYIGKYTQLEIDMIHVDECNKE